MEGQKCTKQTDLSMLIDQMPVYDSFLVCGKRTKNQVALSLRLGVPLAETLVLGVVACCEGNDHKTCLDCSSQLQLKGQPTPSPPPSLPPPPFSFLPLPCIPPPLHSPGIAVVLQLWDPPVRTWVLIIRPDWGRGCCPDVRTPHSPHVASEKLIMRWLLKAWCNVAVVVVSAGCFKPMHRKSFIL